MFKRDWWQFFDEVPQIDEGAQSWDLAFKSGDQHDFVVGLVAGRRGANIYLLDRFKAHASFRETCWAMHNMTTRYPRASRIYVEDKANGPAVLDALRHDVAGLVAVEPEGGKYSRAAACEPRVEAGNVYLPRPTALNGRAIPERAWVHDLIEQLAIFPKGEHDDDVDAFSQLLIQWARPHFSQELMDEIHKINEEAWEPSRWPKKL
jgi:predicted phage terminase large subunit-like protein